MFIRNPCPIVLPTTYPPHIALSHESLFWGGCVLKPTIMSSEGFLVFRINSPEFFCPSPSSLQFLFSIRVSQKKKLPRSLSKSLCRWKAGDPPRYFCSGYAVAYPWLEGTPVSFRHPTRGAWIAWGYTIFKIGGAVLPDADVSYFAYL